MKGLLFLLLIPAFAHAQSVNEVGWFFGVSNYQGDLNTKALRTIESYPATGFTYSHALNDRLSIRYALSFGSLGGADKYYPEDYNRYKRNVSFKTQLQEIDAIVLLRLASFKFMVDQSKLVISPVFGIGLGLFHFDPKTILNDKVYYLRSLPTELGKPHYSLVQFSFPIHFGIRLAVTDKVFLSTEIGLRKTFTDYIDDVSDKYSNYNEVLGTHGPDIAMLTDRSRELGPQYKNQKINDLTSKVNRGNPENKDSYIFAGVTISYAFDIQRSAVPHTKEAPKETPVPKVKRSHKPGWLERYQRKRRFKKGQF